MIIGIDASRANKKHKTGVEWYAYHLIQELKKIDHKNQYFLYTREKLTSNLAECPSNFKEVILRWPPKYLWTQIRLSWEMKFGKYKPDVLFVPAHVLPLGHPKNSVVTVHDVGFKASPKLYNWKDKLYHNWSTKFIAKHASKIITISEFSRSEIMKYYPKTKDKIKVTHIGFDSDKFKKIDNKELIQKTLDKFKINAPYFLNVARLEKKKNVIGLIQAFKKFVRLYDKQNKYSLVLVGGRGAGYSEIENEIKNSKLEHKIKIIDWVAKDDLVKLYNGAEIFIFPSLYEGFGIPPLEAMACGTPVITSDRASLPEVVENSALTVDPNEPDVIARAMHYILTKPELKAKLIQSGFKQIKKFSWSKCARDTLNVIQSLT